MPTLSRWFTNHYERLTGEGKQALAESFETLRSAFFQEDVAAVTKSLPTVYQLSDAFDEPAIRLAADYYAILLNTAWRGDLARGLDLATQGVVRSARVLQPGETLEWYLRETLLDAWLSTDGKGYASDVLKVLEGIDTEGWPIDMSARVEILRACVRVQIDSTCGVDALATITGLLPSLTCWEPAYRHRLRGMALTWAGRLQEAIQDYASAAEEFRQMGFPIAANDSRLSMGIALLQAGDVDQALEVLRASLSAGERLPNRAQVGMAQGSIGQGLIAQSNSADGYAWLNTSLETLDGLGWLRLEAEFALERIRAGDEIGAENLDADYIDASRRVARLRSTDLRRELENLRDGS